MNSTRVWTLLTVLLVLLSCGSAAADNTWIVSITDAVECSDGEDCGPPDFAGVTPATFFHVDIEKKVITLLEPASRRGETTPIERSLQTPDGWLLCGLQENRGWSMFITREHMTLSLTMDGTTWTAFGRVMPVEHAKP